MKNKLRLLFLMMLIMGSAVHAYNVGTKAGVIFTHPTANSHVDYLNSQNGQFDVPFYGTALDTTVTAVYGITLNSKVTKNYTTAGVSTNMYTENFKNISNTTTNFTAATNGGFVSLAGNPGTLANWRHGFVGYTTTTNVKWDSNFIFRSQIKPAADARNASRAAIDTVYAISGFVGNYYLGFNDVYYGGATTYNITLEAQINGPDMVVKRRLKDVRAPLSYTGPSTDSVPGSMVTFNIVLRNEGSATANNVFIVDRIPAYTNFSASTGNKHGGGVSVTFQCATNANPPYTFGSCPTNYTFPNSVTAIRFDAASVTPNSYVTLNYSVVIQ